MEPFSQSWPALLLFPLHAVFFSFPDVFNVPTPNPPPRHGTFWIFAAYSLPRAGSVNNHPPYSEVVPFPFMFKWTTMPTRSRHSDSPRLPYCPPTLRSSPSRPRLQWTRPHRFSLKFNGHRLSAFFFFLVTFSEVFLSVWHSIRNSSCVTSPISLKRL